MQALLMWCHAVFSHVTSGFAIWVYLEWLTQLLPDLAVCQGLKAGKRVQGEAGEQCSTGLELEM